MLVLHMNESWLLVQGEYLVFVYLISLLTLLEALSSYVCFLILLPAITCMAVSNSALSYCCHVSFCNPYSLILLSVFTGHSYHHGRKEANWTSGWGRELRAPGFWCQTECTSASSTPSAAVSTSTFTFSRPSYDYLWCWCHPSSSWRRFYPLNCSSMIWSF